MASHYSKEAEANEEVAASRSAPPPPYTNNAAGSTFAPPPASAVTAPTISGKVTMRDRFYQWSVKIGTPINKITNRLGSEAFWPSSLDLESEKAARILKSFTHDGFYTNALAQTHTGSHAEGPKKERKAIVKISPATIQAAAGIAIFTTFRSGLHFSGAGGSGVLVARLPDGRWSPPSGFLVHTLGAGFMIGLDIYDCVCILRTPEAVKAFTHPRVSLGGEIGLVAGPVGAGGSVEAALAAKTAASPIWSYMKSRGFYAGIQADGTIIVGRPDANADFYGVKGITVDDIVHGNVPPPSGASKMRPDGHTPITPWPEAIRHLQEVLKSVEGRKDVDEAIMREVSAGPTPGDLGLHDAETEVQVPSSTK